MKIARYLAHGSEHYGVVDGDQVTAIGNAGPSPRRTAWTTSTPTGNGPN